jgi:hypothetical protein
LKNLTGRGIQSGSFPVLLYAKISGIISKIFDPAALALAGPLLDMMSSQVIDYFPAFLVLGCGLKPSLS